MHHASSMDETPASLWRNRSFVRLWLAQIMSNAGSQITYIALPLTAVLIIPLAGLAGGDVLLIAAGQAVANIGATIWGVNQMSLRQSITPVGLFARATAARRVLMISMQILGAALGGFLGSLVGLRTTLVIGALGLVVGFLLVLLSPVRRVGNILAINS